MGGGERAGVESRSLSQRLAPCASHTVLAALMQCSLSLNAASPCADQGQVTDGSRCA
jgi:hypothetical protein